LVAAAILAIPVACQRDIEDNRDMDTNADIGSRIIAKKLASSLDKDSLPTTDEWNKAMPVAFCSDWRGENPDPQRETEVRALWSNNYLYLRFCCRYREIYVYEGGNSRRDQLWMRDVAEVFIHRAADELRRYREFEISPNGDWLDLEINAGEKFILMCNMKSRVIRDPEKWIAELALPMETLTSEFNPEEIWRLNLFRIEGAEPNRFYSAWRSTNTPKPNFHIPERFGELLFAST
jgi:hypothetical protein